MVLGAVLFAAGLIDHWVVAPKSALCQSGIGQIGQAIDTTVATDCGLVNALEAAVGWLLVVGVLAFIFGAYVIYNSRSAPQPAPATPWSNPPAPYPPPAQPYNPPAQPHPPRAQPYPTPAQPNPPYSGPTLPAPIQRPPPPPPPADRPWPPQQS